MLSYFPPLLWALFLWLENFTKESEVVVNVLNTDLQTDVYEQTLHTLVLQWQWHRVPEFAE